MKYEEAFRELETIVNQIEDGEISLDELSEKIKRASHLLNFCKSKLISTQQDVEAILKDLED
ncbi:MAG: exodeoxyribonuclease VII small subunit [Bacteroidales bacterium]|nr:exodeoxyribonuclease VII small subunit [Bacteroidales bacterium]